MWQRYDIFSCEHENIFDRHKKAGSSHSGEGPKGSAVRRLKWGSERRETVRSLLACTLLQHKCTVYKVRGICCGRRIFEGA